MAKLELSRAELLIIGAVVTLVLGGCLGGVILLGMQALSGSDLGGLGDLARQLPLDLGSESLATVEPSGGRQISEPSTSSQLPVSLPSPARSMTLTFVTVFVAEMGDKTQLATMLMSAQSRSPWAIFFGSASALVTASLISVVLGEGLSQVLPPATLQVLAGSGFIVIGAYVLLRELWTQESD